MPKIQTTRFGVLQVNDSELIRFAEGIPGFPEEMEFLLIPVEEKSPFVFMQSVKRSDLAFLLTNPFLFFKDYEFVIDDETMEELELEEAGQAAFYSILTMQGAKITALTANLVAPIVINLKNRKAKQVVLERSRYTTKHLLFGKVEEGGETR